MSNAIEQRVVEMRFDNSHFEKNVSTSMSTLEKLKQKLNLSGASKGLDNISNSAKNVNMNPLGSAVESVSAKFSALQVMGVTALANITNSAVNAGKNIVKSLTIDPIKSGFEEYETKMGSIQTILANTEHQGTTLDDVTRALDELNTYADKTIYNFQQMTKNIGTFTAAGVDLDTSVRSIQGIANLAAVSGSTSQQASTAMYQLSQALASGTVKLQDWNSVVNAGMGGKVFQNALTRTAAVMAGAAEDVEAWRQKNIEAHGSFRESLTQGAWLTTDVLTATLEQFTMAAEEGSDAWNEYKKTLTDSGYTEAQAEEILKMANTATDAATKVKTFTQLMDTLKESAQSGWAQTWETIVGDFEEAKVFFTELSDLFGGIIGDSADRRNSFFGEAMTSNWDKLIATINEAGIETEAFEKSIENVVGKEKLEGLVEEFGSIEAAVKKSKITVGDLQKALEKTATTEFIDLSEIAEKVKNNKFLLHLGTAGEDVVKVQKALEGLGYELSEFGADGKFGRETYTALMEFQRAHGLVIDGIAGPKTIAALQEAGSKMKQTADNVDDVKLSAKGLIEEITKKSGRELLLDSLMNVIKAIQRPLSAVGEAMRDVFSVTPDQLYNALEKLNKFTSSFVMKGVLDETTWDGLTAKISELGIEATEFEKVLTKTLKKNGVDVDKLTKKYGSLGKAFEKGAISFDTIKEALLSFDGISESLLTGGEAAEKVRRTFEGLFAAIDAVATLAAIPFKLGFSVISKVLGRLGLSILDVTAEIGDAFVGFRDRIDTVIDTISTVIVDGVGKWISEFKETQFFETCAEWISSASETISDAIDEIQNAINNFDASSIVQHLESFGNFISTIATKLSNSEIFISFVDGVCNAFAKLTSYLPKLKLPEFNVSNLTNLTKLFANFEGADVSGFTGMITELGNYFRGIGSFNWETFKNKALEKFVTFWLKTGDKVKEAFKVCKEVATAIKEFIFGAEDVNLPTILGLAEKFLGLVVLFKTLQTLNNLAAPFDNVTDALNNFASSLKWNAMSSAFKSMAIALGAFTVCILILTSIGDGDMKKAWSAAGMLITLMIVMGGVVSAIAFFASKVEGGLNAASAAAALLMVVVAIMLLVTTLKQIDNLNLQHTGKTFMILAGILVALTAGVRMISKAGGSSFKSVAAILTLMAALKLILDVIDAYDAYDWTGKNKAIGKMVQALIMLSVAINIASRGVQTGASASGLALLLIAMVVSLKILLSVIEEFANMDTDKLVKGGVAVTALLGIMTGLMFTMGKANKGRVLEKGQKSVNNFAGLAVALLAVVAAIWVLGKMDLDTLTQGGIAVAGILLLFTGMLSAVGKSCSGLKMGSIITMLIAIGVLMAEAAIIIHTMKSIPWQTALSSAGALTMMLLAMAGVLRTLTKHNIKAKNIFKWIGAMATFALVLAELAIVLNLVKDINPINAIGNVVALSGLMTAMAGVLITLGKHRNGAKSIYKWIGAMATFALVVAELAIVLNLIKDINPANAIGNVLAIDILLAGMAVCLTTLSGHRNGAKSIYKWIGAMATFGLVLAELAEILWLVKDINPANAIGNVIALSGLLLALTASLTIMSKCKVKANFGVIAAVALLGLVAAELVGVIHLMRGLNPAEVIPQVIALSILVTVLSLVLIPLTVAGTLGTGALLGVGALAILATSLFILVGVLAAMTKVTEASANAKVLAGLLTVLTLVLIPLTVIGAFGLAGLMGVGVLATLMVSLFIVVGVLASMQGIQNAQHNADILIQLLTTMTDALVQISMLAPLAIVGVVALGALIGLVRTMGALVIAVGALVEYIPGIEGFIDTGLEVFKKLAEGLGEIVSAFAVGLTSGLAEAGANLSAFVFAAMPFITMVRTIDESVSTGAGILVTALLEFLAADFIAGKANATGTSLTDLGIELSGFASNIGGFISAMSEIKPETVTGVETLCNALNALTTANLKDTITQLIPGDNSLATFGTSIKEFAGCIKEAAGSLKNITDEDVENIKRSATAGEALADLNSAIPSQGGWAQNILGSKELGAFGQSINAFADCLVSYSEKVSGKNIDADAITNSAAAAQSIADLNGAIPAQGGWAQEVMGSKDLATFGQSITAFADCLVSYSSKVAGQNMDSEAITRSADAAGALASLNGKLPSQNGLYQAVMGEKNLGEFGTQLASFADGIVAYANAAANIDETKITAITNSGKALDELVLVMDKIPSSGGWKEKIFGSSDGQTFGGALSSVAKGVESYCTVAATIGEDDITAIQNSKTAITELANVLSDVPETSDSEKAAALSTAVSDLISIGSRINLLSAAAYDYSGLSTLKTQISKLTSIINEAPAADVSSGFASLKTAAQDAANCASKLAGLNNYTYEGIGRFKEALTSLGGADIDKVISAFSGKADRMASAMDSLIKAMSSGLKSGSGDVSKAMSSLVADAVKAATSKASDFKSAGKSFATNLADGIKINANGVFTAGKSLASSATTGAKSGYTGMYTAGYHVATGFAAGILSGMMMATSAGAAIAEAAFQAAMRVLKEKSPSRVMYDIGAYAGEGFVIGLSDYTGKADAAGAEVATSAIDGISGAISKVTDAINSDIDAQPTIRPVLDLSGVESGAGRIGDLLGSTSVGVSSNLSAISTMMNRRGQNGANDDVVSAIDRLNNRLDNLGNTTYSINGITYDDGSNVSRAISEITRYAIMERRV